MMVPLSSEADVRGIAQVHLAMRTHLHGLYPDADALSG